MLNKYQNLGFGYLKLSGAGFGYTPTHWQLHWTWFWTKICVVSLAFFTALSMRSASSEYLVTLRIFRRKQNLSTCLNKFIQFKWNNLSFNFDQNLVSFQTVAIMPTPRFLGSGVFNHHSKCNWESLRPRIFFSAFLYGEADIFLHLLTPQVQGPAALFF